MLISFKLSVNKLEIFFILFFEKLESNFILLFMFKIKIELFILFLIFLEEDLLLFVFSCGDVSALVLKMIFLKLIFYYDLYFLFYN